MRYVHHAETHRRPIPAEVLAAGAAITEPDERVLAMLGARASVVTAASDETKKARRWPGLSW